MAVVVIGVVLEEDGRASEASPGRKRNVPGPLSAQATPGRPSGATKQDQVEDERTDKERRDDRAPSGPFRLLMRMNRHDNPRSTGAFVRIGQFANVSVRAAKCKSRATDLRGCGAGEMTKRARRTHGASFQAKVAWKVNGIAIRRDGRGAWHSAKYV